MTPAFAFGPFRLYPQTRQLRRDGADVGIGSRAFDMLVALIAQRGTVASRRDLMIAAWPGLVVDDSNIRVQMANLRRLLGCGKDGTRYVASVAGRGYCFVGMVSEILEPAPPGTDIYARNARVAARLSVFAGNFSLADAMAVALFSPVEASELVDALSSLVQYQTLRKTLVDGRNTYRMTVADRASASNRLKDDPDRAEVTIRHALLTRHTLDG